MKVSPPYRLSFLALISLLACDIPGEVPLVYSTPPEAEPQQPNRQADPAPRGCNCEASGAETGDEEPIATPNEGPVVTAPSSPPVGDDSISVGAREHLGWVQSNVGYVVGTGGCNAITSNVWSKTSKVGRLEHVAVLPGDLLEWSAGSGFQRPGQNWSYLWTSSGHYAVVEKVQSGDIGILHQNVNGSAVQRDTVRADHVRGTVLVFRIP